MKAVLTLTDFQKNLRWEQSEITSGSIDCMKQVSVYPAARRQTFRGFGGAFTEAAAYAYQQLPEDKRSEFMQAYFGENGLRYRWGRTHIGSCDFSLGNYACIQDEKDTAFNTDRDEKYLLPMLRDAEKVLGEPVGLMLTPWSPPPFMKTNGEMNHGGKLKEEYRALWAKCMAKYVRFYRESGCDVKLISIQNEPDAVQTWDSCIYSAQEEGEFAPILRAALNEEGCGDIKLLAWDHNKDIFVYRADGTLSVPGADEAVDGFAIHWYTGDHFEAVRVVRDLYPSKDMWFTEGCVEYSRFDGKTALEKAEMYAHDIIGNLNSGICGSIDWNLLLDAKGGPNHVGNFCEAPLMLNSDGSDFEIMSEYYYIGHFSRFIEDGAVCLASSSYCPGVEAAVFENPDGKRVAILLNRTEDSLPVSLTDNGKDGFRFELAARSIATLEW